MCPEIRLKFPQRILAQRKFCHPDPYFSRSDLTEVIPCFCAPVHIFTGDLKELVPRERYYKP